ncbi:hypothetical protein MRS44_006846 [Fusarium solani]|uniref:uncharacterized protein n=1 Tax=Fusarium solani TaxID=169388 RepID=UPI0032C3D8AF|nr:hypothetical protein MRS44_006846 [Fusarium solani]
MSQDSQNRQRPPVTPSPDGEPNDKVLYKSIRGEYEIRVLEIKPGSGNETLRGALHRYPVSCMKRLARALARTGTSVKWIYGLLGVCEDRDKEAVIKNDRTGSTAVDLYVNMTTHHLLRERKVAIRLTTLLAALDHESPDLPSWVPDWRVPPRMHALGLSVRT